MNRSGSSATLDTMGTVDSFGSYDSTDSLLSTGSAGSSRNQDTYTNVGFKAWNCEGGTLKLLSSGLVYKEARPGTRVVKVRWNSLCRPITTSASVSSFVRHTLKMKSPDKSTMYEYCFSTEDAETLERLRLHIIACQDKYQDNNNNNHQSSLTLSTIDLGPLASSSSHDPLSEHVFFGINYLQEAGGRLVLKSQELLFVTSYEKELVSISWQSIRKVQMNRSVALPLVRIVDSEQKSYTFEMMDKTDAGRLRDNIKYYRSSSSTPAARVPQPVQQVTTNKEEVSYAAKRPSKGRNRLQKMVSIELENAETGSLLNSKWANDDDDGDDTPLLKVPMISQRHGDNKRKLEQCRGFGAYPLLVGPAADQRELEYISSLHQNTEPILRSDGTISSRDIIPYLSSRYAVKITNEQALDIVANLCGGKFRNLASAELDAEAEERRKLQEELRELVTCGWNFGCCSNKEIDEGGDEDPDEEVLYYDLVQVTSLLMVPELLQLKDLLAKKAPKEVGFAKGHFQLQRSVAFHTSEGAAHKEPARLAADCDRIVLIVIESLIEVLDEQTQNEIRSGHPLEAATVQALLRSFGDSDGANDFGLIKEMMNALSVNGGPPVLTPHSFIAALTSDVDTYYGSKGRRPELDRKTSVHFDVLGYNWDDVRSEQRKQALDPNSPGSVKMVTSGMSIDYVADVYRSVMQNTAAWCCFFFFVLLVFPKVISEINYSSHSVIGSLFKSNYTGELTDVHGDRYKAIVASPGSESDQCGHLCTFLLAIVNWIMQAFACGVFGFVIVLSTSTGNVFGRHKRWLLFSLVACLALIGVGIGGVNHTAKEAQTASDKAEDNPQYCIRIPSRNAVVPNTDSRRLAGIDQNCIRVGVELITRVMTQSDVMSDFEELPFVGGVVTELGNTIQSYSEEMGNLTVYQLVQCSHTLSKVDFGQVMEYMMQNGQEMAGTVVNKTYEAAVDAAYGVVDETVVNLGEFVNDTIDVVEDAAVEVVGAAGSAVGDAIDGMASSGLSVAKTAGTLSKAGDENTEASVKDLFSEVKISGTELSSTKAENDEKMVPVVGNLEKEEAVATSAPVAAPNGAQELKNGASMVTTKILDPLAGVPICLRRRKMELLLVEALNLDGKNVTLLGSTMDMKRAVDYLEVILEEANWIIVDKSTGDNNGWPYYMSSSLILAGLFAMFATMKALFCKRDGLHRGRDYKIKCAASHKVANLIENALSMHVVHGGGTKGQTMRNFFRFGEQVASVGGLTWNAKEVWSQAISWKQGIRISGRFWIGQVMQVAVTGAGVLYGWRILVALHSRTGFASLGPLNLLLKIRWGTNFELAVDVAGSVAILAGLLAAAFCIFSYLPSYTKTVLYLRSGVIPSLHDPGFLEYRSRGDDVVQNIGNMVFSLMGASVMSAFFAFVLLFLCIYSKTMPYVLSTLASAIGIGCTIGIKTVGQNMLRARNFSSFYRRNPSRANYSNLFFECWYIGTGLLMVISRLAMFVIVGSIYIGRIDVDFFNTDIRVFGANLDSAPVGFRRDILSHEAHLHPYIERLGSMYLARLRHGSGFGSRAGTAWRCLFVNGLMPWSVKHRVNSKDTQ